MTDRTTARRLAQESLARGDALGWFEELYAQAGGDESVIPWADMKVNPNFLQWLTRTGMTGEGKKALVIGCGLGDDAEALSDLGFRVVAFDVAPTAIGWSQRRFVNSKVEYVVADLFNPPASWGLAFHLVLEAYTLQTLPAERRIAACGQIAWFVAPGGTLLVITRGREAGEDAGQMPWPLVREELAILDQCGLSTVRFEDYVENEHPPVRRFRVEYRKE